MKTLATMLMAAVLCTGCVGSLLESGNEAPEVYRLAGASLQDRGEQLPLALAVAPPRASASRVTCAAGSGVMRNSPMSIGAVPAMMRRGAGIRA